MVEVLIALLLLGIVGGGLMGVLANSSSNTITADVRATAESIARSQLESIKDEDYKTDPTTYTTINLTPFGGNPPWNVSIIGELRGAGLQQITVTISHNGQTVIALDGYKS